MADNVIKAVFASGRRVKTAPLWRYDHGIRLQIVGLELPEHYEMHFSNSKTGKAKTQLADSTGAVIPAEYLIPGSEVYAWVYLAGDSYGRTKAEIIIPVDPKAQPTDQEPTPEQQSVLEQAIEALNSATEDIQGQIDNALQEAKDSGEFDGPPGQQGETGATGATGPQGPQGATGPGVPAGGTVGQVLFKGFGGDYVTGWGDIPKQVKIFDFTVSDGTVTGPTWGEIDDMTLTYDILAVAKVDFDGQYVFLPCTFYEPPAAGNMLKIQFSGIVGDGIVYMTITSGNTENTWAYYEWNITEEIGNSLTKYQGIDNAGKFLVVGADGNVITQAVEENNSLAAFATDTASGAIASFTDGADDIPVKDLTIAIEPVQAGSGDPSPSNVRPISGWTGVNMARTGKNLFDKNDPDVMHGYAVSTTSGTLYKASSGIWSASGFMPVKGGNQYIISGDNVANDLAFYDANKVFISGVTDGRNPTTAPANARYARMDYTIANEDRIQFEQSSAATAYEAYQGETYAISFPTEAGTVYGGTLDVATGKLRSEWLMCDGGDLDWVKVSNSDFRNFYAQGPDVLFYANDVSSILSSAYKSTNNNASTASDDLYVWATAWRPNNVISVKDTAKGSMTAEEFKAAMAGVQFLCKRSTPVEFELTPIEVKTLLGQNTIWADCGDSTVEYRADTKLYVDKKIAAIPSVPMWNGGSY